MKRTIRWRTPLATLLVGLTLLLPACGGDSGSLFDGLGVPSFWASDERVDAATADPYYRLSASLRGTGQHCYVYVEAGQDVPQATVDRIIREFDNTIYPSVTGAFGAEWNPGVDGDPRITLLLLDIRDGYSPVAGGGYIAGSFAPVNEYLQGELDPFPEPAGYVHRSNEREMLLLDLNPGDPGSQDFLNTIAHELQHMVHWNQKSRIFAVEDDTWLNEAMSEAAPLYCSYPLPATRISQFASTPSDSLTVWNGQLPDYAAAFMWAKYQFDQHGNAGLFRQALQRPSVGIASVDEAFAAIGSARTFASSFRDWSVAVMVAGDNASLFPVVAGMGRPEWRYTSLTLPTLLSPVTVQNARTLDPLPQWSAGYFVYDNLSTDNGTVTWNPVEAHESATFISQLDNTVTDVLPGAPYPYSGKGYLVVRNATGTDNGSTLGATVTYTSRSVPEVGTALFRALAFSAPAPVAVVDGPRCGKGPFASREHALRARGLRVRAVAR